MWFFTKRQAPKGEVESAVDARQKNVIKPSARFNSAHLLYLLTRDAIPGMIVTAAINMAISYVMYVLVNRQSTVYLFHLPKSLAGDAAVTILVHCLVTWFLKFRFVHYDLRHGTVQPIDLLDDEMLTEDVCWVMFLSPESGTTVERVRMNSPKWIARHILRALCLAFFVFLAYWPISLIPLIMFGDREGNDFTYDRRWIPQVYKTTLGGVLGFTTAPLLSLIWLVRCGWVANQEK
ncbi:hypothetical protein E4U53_001799 [Claviceps sorghi]|nr:hypothetical protein E4U53_001799 [Claviceps sorghi]